MKAWVVAELSQAGVAPVTWEALEETTELAGAGGVGVLAVGRPAAEAALGAAVGHGAGRVVLLDAPPGSPEADAMHLAWALRDGPAAGGAPLVVLGHTPYGRALAPRLAVALDAAVIPEAIALRRAPGGGIDATRPIHGERLYATVRTPGGVPTVVTLRPGALGISGPRPGPPLAVERHAVPARETPRGPRRRRLIPADPATVDLREAERIVAGGRGVGGPEGFARLQELARWLGAAVGGSRVAVDLGWLPWERQVGQSGQTVAPRLYLAIGISGASQHLAGIREAGTVVAINTDPGAPILSCADLGIVADWRPVVEALIRELRARRAARKDEVP